MVELNIAHRTADTTFETIDDAVHGKNVAEKPPRYGYRLKPSNIGETCERQLWFEFRWAYELEEIDPRKQRIFDAGNRIEADILRDMQLVMSVTTHTEDGKQLGVSFADGHGYGFIDGYVWTGIEELGQPDAESGIGQAIFEAKSAKNTDFNAIKKHGVEKKKQLHYSQLQLYMRLWGLPYGLYVVECKNTSNRQSEILEHDENHTDHLLSRSHRLAFSDERPARAYDARGKYPCNFCKSEALCYGDAIIPPRSCRTCAHVTPWQEGKWLCEAKGRAELSRKDQEAGCDQHLFNPAFINGKPVGGDGVTHIQYQMDQDDSVWVDQVATQEATEDE